MCCRWNPHISLICNQMCRKIQFTVIMIQSMQIISVSLGPNTCKSLWCNTKRWPSMVAYFREHLTFTAHSQIACIVCIFLHLLQWRLIYFLPVQCELKPLSPTWCCWWAVDVRQWWVCPAGQKLTTQLSSLRRTASAQQRVSLSLRDRHLKSGRPVGDSKEGSFW